MCSVTQRIKSVKQPRGGFINPRQLDVESDLYERPRYPQEDENINAGLIGITTDYLTRYLFGTPIEVAFSVSIEGMRRLGKSPLSLLNKINGLDNKSISAAIKLASYDCVVRNGITAAMHHAPEKANQSTCENIRTMVTTSRDFLFAYGPVIESGIGFPGGYTDVVTSGDGDYLTANGLWDMKVSKRAPTKDHTLQLLMYWLMGSHSSLNYKYANVEKLGIYNPRLGSVFSVEIDSLSKETLHQVEVDVIGYKEKDALF